MAAEKKFTGTIGRTLRDTRFEFDVKETLPKDAPNVVYIVMDDMGFAHLGCYGSDINTPNLDALAADGLRYNNFHTTAICSATRTSLLTGANHHEAGCNSLIELQTGVDNGLGYLNPEYATTAEILHEYGYATFAVGKWHLANPKTQAGPYNGWPLQKGFDRYYGFLQAENDQFHPQLVRDNSLLTPEEVSLRTERPGYHFSADIVDNAIENIFTQKNAFPEQPFFLYLAFGAMHAPHHAPEEYINKYKGKFDEGWDAKRQKWYERQKELGIIPLSAELTARNEYVDAWDDLPEDKKKIYARLMEAYAGLLEYTDEQIGRLVDYLKEIGEYENTVIVFISDNGASSEGGKDGRYNLFEGMDIFSSDQAVAQLLQHYDEIGTEQSAPHYPTGWASAGNTPFQWYKIWTHEGGVRDPLIISWPRGIKDRGAIRSQYHHVSDITPTILDIIGIEKPDHIKGAAQKEFSGISLAYTFDDADAEGRRHVQYYEIFGNRSIYKDGWKAVVNHTFSKTYSDDEWELYHVDEDFSENRNVAGEYPEKLRELQDEFLIEAARHKVFPLLNNSFNGTKGNPGEALYGGLQRNEAKLELKGVFRPYDLAESHNLDLDYTSYHFEADIERESVSDEGVIFSTGDRYAGYTLYIKDNILKFVYNLEKLAYYSAEIPDLPAGRLKVSYDYIYIDKTIRVELYIDGHNAAEVSVPRAYYSRGFVTTVRADKYTPVSPEYEVPFEFSGKIHRVYFHQAPNTVNAAGEIMKILHAE